MKLLLDTCVWGKAQHALAEAGHDIEWAGDWEEDPGDEEILARADRDGRILVTLDKDFAELCLRALELYGKELLRGAVVTAEPGRFRVRPHTEK